MSEATYNGSCHCGKVRYEVHGLDLSKPVTVCNCSICQRSGSMLTFVPATQFTLKSGEADLRDYTFNKGAIHHMLCPTCGIKSFARANGRDGTPMVAVNARCLEGVDVDTLEIHKFNGRAA